MKLNRKTAENLIRLLRGETLPYSRVKNRFTDELIDEHILHVSGKHKRTVRLNDALQLRNYLHNQYGIKDLEQYLEALRRDEDRAGFTRLTGNSKLSKQRTFKGFLVNSYTPVPARLNGEPFEIRPQEGSFVFIYDFEEFRIPAGITVVGVENALNFRHIHRQARLFGDREILFVSRYPQSQSKDFIRWMQSVPNPYWHFGDLDYAGINIYLNEYKKHLGDQARFFVPPTIAEDLKHGSRERYDKQKPAFDPSALTEPDLIRLVQLIEKEQKGLDQEFYIGGE